jgi:hypothetical protein
MESRPVTSRFESCLTHQQSRGIRPRLFLFGGATTPEASPAPPTRAASRSPLPGSRRDTLNADAIFSLTAGNPPPRRTAYADPFAHGFRRSANAHNSHRPRQLSNYPLRAEVIRPEARHGHPLRAFCSAHRPPGICFNVNLWRSDKPTPLAASPDCRR